VVHRERQYQTADVIDGTPYPNIVMFASKVISLWFIIACLLLFGLMAAVLMQLTEGYTNFEFGRYFQSLFFVQGGFFFLLAVFAVFIQVLSGNRWLGMIGMLVTFITFQALPSLDFQHGLYSFGTPPAPHSDMNGYGHYWMPVVAFSIYWAFFCGLLALVSHLLFQRGRTHGFVDRVKIARLRLNSGVVTCGVLLLLSFAGTGGWIFYNTNILNSYTTGDAVEAQQADYEKVYKKYQLMKLPEVLAVDSTVDLFPAQRRLESKGTARMVNKSNQVLDEILISTHPLAIVNSLALTGGRLGEISENDAAYGAHLFQFESGLQPGQEAEMSWDITWKHVGFANPNEAAVTAGANNRVVANGTFVNNTEIMPAPGYNNGLELSDPNTRREYELPPIIRLPKLGDPDWIGRSQFGVAERSDFRTVFSTSADQIAVAPGYLVGEVQERDGRKFYTYEMDAPIWPFFAFVSARYEVATDKWNDVDIEVYYDAKHPYNIEPMIRGTKKSLDYFSVEFTPYQYRQFRILEFPRYASFAQSFPNTIPFSEAIGFVADLRDEHALDLVFYVTAHELAHQWWGHQVAGARMQGMTVIVETLAQYSALMVMEKEYGHDKMRRFLRYELDNYLRSRGGEQIEELPLMLTENQQYIHYRKGSLVMYALQDVIGEDQVNLALRNFLDKYAYGNGPFPTAADLVDEFRAVAQSEHQAMITDLFEQITLYDFSVDEATVQAVGDEWEVTFSTSAKKYYADGEGVETESPLHSWVDIAVFPAEEEELEDYQLPLPLFFEKRLIESGTNEITVRVQQRPERVGIDPYNKLIDRNPEDNLKTISEAPS
jgi:ABC-2 type transport system permease protein